jgi:ABC-type phosphate/phosphonate transport system substrate-binding protein
VRGPALHGWGAVPATARITFSAGILSVLRRAAAGEKIAAVLDGEQTAALASLPFANDLEVVARSNPLPVSVLSIVGDRLSPAEAEALAKALLRLHETEEGKEVLTRMRMKRFLPVDAKRLDAAQRTFKHSGGPGK